MKNIYKELIVFNSIWIKKDMVYAGIFRYLSNKNWTSISTDLKYII